MRIMQGHGRNEACGSPGVDGHKRQRMCWRAHRQVKGGVTREFFGVRGSIDTLRCAAPTSPPAGMLISISLSIGVGSEALCGGRSPPGWSATLPAPSRGPHPSRCPLRALLPQPRARPWPPSWCRAAVKMAAAPAGHEKATVARVRLGQRRAPFSVDGTTLYHGCGVYMYSCTVPRAT